MLKLQRTATYNFQKLDEILARASVKLLTINPQKKFMTSFVELGNLITEETTDSQIITTMINTLEIIVCAQLQNFPDNIFWDFDFIASRMLRQALAEKDGTIAYLEKFAHKMVSLMEVFGIKGQIKFRYVHDFIYGFDWARWVQKDPENRSNVEPFSLVILDYLLNKSDELAQRIHQNRCEYYKLCAKGYRNPFGFSREPEDEYRLLTNLAQKRLIPVPAWSWYGVPTWNQPFDDLRQEVALKLNVR